MTGPQSTDLRTEGLARLEKCREFRKRGFPLDTAAPLMLGEAAAVGDEIERLRNVCADGLKQLDSNVTEIGRLRAAIYQACSDMGCYCADDDPLPENLKCPMCKLEKALHGSAADVSGCAHVGCTIKGPHDHGGGGPEQAKRT